MFHVYVPELICDRTIALLVVFDLNSAFMYLYPWKPNIKEYIAIGKLQNENATKTPDFKQFL